MKRRLAILTLFTLLLAACAQDNTAPDNPNQQQNANNVKNTFNKGQSNTKNTTTMFEKMDELAFNKYEFDLDYNQADNDFEVELKKQPDGTVEAEYKDKSKEINAKGEEAFDLLFPKLKEMNINVDTPQEEVIAKALQAFDIPDNYTELELEITFNDGTKKEYGQNM